MSFDKSIKTALNESLAQETAVAVYRKPGSKTVVFCGRNVANNSTDAFIVTPWNKLFKDSVAISNAEESQVKEQLSPLSDSTPKDKYLSQIESVIEQLKVYGGKTVISRTIHLGCCDVDWVNVAERLFDRFPEALCYVFYHPELGAWMGATPELLFRNSKLSRAYETMALAGTKGICEEWDYKNIEEQRIVADYITDTLAPFSESITIKETESLRYGSIEHICTRITGKMKDGVNRDEILDCLSPTPAVGGFPKTEALNDIKRIEFHDRGCYGGYLTFCDDDTNESYVILRCIRFDNEGYTAYTGSGITAKSNPETEWLETAAKAAPLIDIVESVIREREVGNVKR